MNRTISATFCYNVARAVAYVITCALRRRGIHTQPIEVVYDDDTHTFRAYPQRNELTVTGDVKLFVNTKLSAQLFFKSPTRCAGTVYLECFTGKLDGFVNLELFDISFNVDEQFGLLEQVQVRDAVTQCLSPKIKPLYFNSISVSKVPARA